MRTKRTRRTRRTEKTIRTRQKHHPNYDGWFFWTLVIVIIAALVLLPMITGENYFLESIGNKSIDAPMIDFPVFIIAPAEASFCSMSVSGDLSHACANASDPMCRPGGPKGTVMPSMECVHD